MKNDKSWRGMLLKDNDGDWGVAVAAWRGMKKGQPGVPGEFYPSTDSLPINAFCIFIWWIEKVLISEF